MPLTFAHPAAVIPLARYLPQIGILSALVCGSVTPDLPYFTGGLFGRYEFHSLSGLFCYCWPAGVFCYAVYHFLLKQPLLELAPISVSSRWSSYSGGTPPYSIDHWLVVAVSVLIGAATHLAWDAFTHEGGAVVTAWPVLSSHLQTIGGYRIYWYKVLQHGSTFAGLAYLAWSGYRAYRRSRPTASFAPRLPRAVRSIVIAVLFSVVIGAAAIAGYIAARQGASQAVPLQLFLGRAVVVGTAVVAGGLLVYSVFWHAWFARRDRKI